MSEPVYHFRFREKVFGPGTLSQLFSSPLLTQGDAMKIEARQADGSDWTPLWQIVDFHEPWRTALPEGGSLLRLPGELTDTAGAPLTPCWEYGYTYKWRWGGTAEVFPGVYLRNLIKAPPFTAEHVWRVEVQRSGTRAWVPLTSLIDFSQGWPEPPDDDGPPLGAAPAASDSRQGSSRPPAPAPAPGDGVFSLMGVILFVGICITVYALNMDTSVENTFSVKRETGMERTFNLGKANDQGNALAVGLTMSAVSALSMVIRTLKPRPS